MNPDRYITLEEERATDEAGMDLDIITSLKQSIEALIKDAAGRLNNPQGNEPDHDGIINILQHVDDEFHATIKHAEETSGELYKWS